MQLDRYHLTRIVMKKIFVVLLIILLTGCAAYQRKNNQLAQSLYKNPPQAVLKTLESTAPLQRDIAKYHLNIGILQFKIGNFPAAIAALELAKKEMAAVQAISISENTAAATVNETFRSYSGYPTDLVMVHNILALSYLFNNNISGARVEVLQNQVTMKELAHGSSLVGQLASASLISGIIYELLGEQSDALISYRRADNILTDHKLATPMGLKEALLRLSYFVDKNSQYAIYKKRFPGFPTPSKNAKAKIFVLYFDAVVDHKEEFSLLVPSPNGDQIIRIAMPRYPKKYRAISHGTIMVKKQQLKTQLIDNLDLSVRNDLSAIYRSILLLTTSRAVVKDVVVREASERDSLLGLLFNISTVVSEVADLRSWNMLPANIQFAYLETNAETVTLGTKKLPLKKIAIKKGSDNVLLINSLTPNVFHYQQ